MTFFKLRHLMFAILPLALTACVSADDQLNIDQDKCASFGFQPGTDAFANCMMQQSAKRDDDERRSMDRIRAQEQRDKDRKEARRRSASDIDTRPQYDRDGNPNFDTKGNYQGCNGIGCLVDNPDNDG